MPTAIAATVARRKALVDSPVRAAVFYALIAAVVTWPLIVEMRGSIVPDAGDPALNAWIVAWGADHLARLMSGNLHAFSGYWNANIFHPAPLALAYSEHLFALSVQVLPIWMATHNALLCYNVLLFSTFVLSGLGAWLLARDLTGDTDAALVAGLVFACAPYRVAQLSHLQVLSAQWMPLAIYGLRRYLTRPSLLAACGTALALVAQNLSNGYFMLFFSPLFACWTVCEVAARGSWRRPRVMAGLAAMAAVATLCTIPFLLPYLELRALGFKPRSLQEVSAYSADLLSYLTPSHDLHLWPHLLPGYRHAEGELFPGVLAPALALFGTWTSLAAVRKGRQAPSAARPRWYATPSAWALALLVACVVLSLGPEIRWGGATLTPRGPYGLLYRFVPGFDGLRVPARYAMPGLVWLSVLAGIGVAALAPRVRDRRRLVVGLSLVAILEGAAMPLDTNVRAASRRYVKPASRFLIGAELPGVYRYLATLPDAAVIAELPLGDAALDVHYVFYSTCHWKRLVNGYSGGFPRHYRALAAALRLVEDGRQSGAWGRLLATGATHVVVHDALYALDSAAPVHEWLRANGAVPVASFRTDVVYQLPR